MKQIFSALYKIAQIIQVVCIWLATLCIIVWCYRFINMAYDGGGMFFGTIEIVPNIVRGMIPHMVDFAGRPIDVSYFPAAIILLFVHLFMKNVVMETLDKAIKECILKEFEAKEKEEALLNEELQEDLKNNTLAYRYFVGLLDLHLEYTTDENLNMDKKDISLAKDENNKYILDNLFQRYQIKGALKGQKIVIISDNFARFDSILLDLIDDVKYLYKKNRENNLQTSFTLSLDATYDKALAGTSIKILEKISSFRYYNKIIVTTLFSSRYKYCNSPKFELRTMGISRFFDKIVNEQGEISFKTEDFDLYSLKQKD